MGFGHFIIPSQSACTLLLFRRDLDVIILFFIRFKQYSLRFFFFTLVRMIRNKQQASTRPTLDSIFQISILYISSRNNLDFVHRFHFRHGVHVSAMFFFSVWLSVRLISVTLKNWCSKTCFIYNSPTLELLSQYKLCGLIHKKTQWTLEVGFFQMANVKFTS